MCRKTARHGTFAILATSTVASNAVMAVLRPVATIVSGVSAGLFGSAGPSIRTTGWNTMTWTRSSITGTAIRTTKDFQRAIRKWTPNGRSGNVPGSATASGRISALLDPWGSGVRTMYCLS